MNVCNTRYFLTFKGMARLMHQNHVTAVGSSKQQQHQQTFQFPWVHYCNCCVLPRVYIAVISSKLCL